MPSGIQQLLPIYQPHDLEAQYKIIRSICDKGTSLWLQTGCSGLLRPKDHLWRQTGPSTGMSLCGHVFCGGSWGVGASHPASCHSRQSVLPSIPWASLWAVGPGICFVWNTDTRAPGLSLASRLLVFLRSPTLILGFGESLSLRPVREGLYVLLTFQQTP